MEHPSIAEVLAHARGEARADVGEHLARCQACRQLAGVGDPFAQSTPARTLAELTTVPDDLYVLGEPLRDRHAGMGRAYIAFDRRLGREVVYKQIRDADGPAARVLRERFEREARLTARLQHPSIVGVHELGRRANGEPFYTMPFVDGTPLDEAIAAARTDEERLALVPRITAVADAVAYAHDRGVVHRDIKPANILLGAFGETVLIDWGLAKLVDDDADAPVEAPASPGDGLTRMGIGTAAYMPPEQARGEVPDARVDVYAIGATLYHVLSGQPPYGGGPSDAIRAKLLGGPPMPLAKAWPGGSPALVAIVDKAMARDPDARFATALELAEELRRFTTGQLIRSHHYRPGELLRHWSRRHRVALRAGAVAAVAILAIATVSVARIIRERDRAEVASHEARTRAREASSALARSQAARARLLATVPTQRAEALDLALRATGDGGNETFQALVETLGAGPLALALPADSTALAAAPAGDHLLVIATGGRVELIDIRTGEQRHRVTLPTTSVHWAQWSDDGRHAAVLGLDRNVAVIDSATGAVRTVEASPASNGRVDATFLLNGTLVTASGSVLRAWDPVTGARRGETTGCIAVAVTRVDNIAVVGCEDGAIVAWDGTRSARWQAHDAHADVEADRAGTVYSAGGDRRLLAWPRDAIEAALASSHAPAARVILRDVGARVYRLVPLRDSPTIVVSSGTTLFVDVKSGRIHRDPYFSAELERPRSPLLFGSQSAQYIMALDPATFELVVRLAGMRSFTEARVAPAVDATRVAVVTNVGDAWLWDARRGLHAGALAAHDGEIVGILVDPSAQHVVVASTDGLVRASRLSDGAIIATTHVDVEIVAAAQAGDRLTTRHVDGSVRTWSLTGSLVRTDARDTSPISPDTTVIATARSRRHSITATSAGIEVTDTAAGTRVWSLPPRSGIPTALATTPDGAWLIAGYSDGELLVHPLTLAAAHARGCETLRGIGRARDIPACITGSAQTSR